MPAMARLDDHPAHATTGEVAEVAERIRARRGGELLELDVMLLHAPAIADGWNALLGAVRTRTDLAADLRELAILRVAVHNGAGFEWRSHAPIARDAGLGDAELEALRDTSRVGDALTGARRTACAYADAMTVHVEVDDALFTEVRTMLGDRGTAELTATVAAYNMVSRFLVALRVGEG